MFCRGVLRDRFLDCLLCANWAEVTIGSNTTSCIALVNGSWKILGPVSCLHPLPSLRVMWAMRINNTGETKFKIAWPLCGWVTMTDEWDTIMVIDQWLPTLLGFCCAKMSSKVNIANVLIQLTNNLFITLAPYFNITEFHHPSTPHLLGWNQNWKWGSPPQLSYRDCEYFWMGNQAFELQSDRSITPTI